MMELSQLTIHHFRNFQGLTWFIQPQINLIYGDNGSGKTSLLEAIFMLSRGHSFRTHQINDTISHHSDTAILHATLNATNPMTMGYQRQRSGETTYKIQQEKVNTIQEMTRRLPVIFIDAHSHRRLATAPKFRRQVVDWGLFYDQLDYITQWKRYHRALKQRNAALKYSKQTIHTWDHILIESAGQLHQARKAYVEYLNQTITNYLSDSSLTNIHLQYQPGWPAKESFAEALKHSQQRDQQFGFTQYGPHRFDLQMTINDKQVIQFCSQGQQKTIALALAFTQGALVKKRSQLDALYLIDDLGSELDANHQAHTIEQLQSMQSQVILTAIQPVESTSLNQHVFELSI
jgi:DNA replication and repair protein RecF